MGFWDAVTEGGADIDISDLGDVVYDYDGDNLGVSGIAQEGLRRDIAALEYVGEAARNAVPDVDVRHYFDGINDTVQNLSGTVGKAVVVYGVISVGGLYVTYKAGIPQAIGRGLAKLVKFL